MDIDDTYNTDDELRIRKILETWFPYNYTLEKNENKYEYDICLYEIKEYSKKNLVGYIEIETTPDWDTYSLPDSYCFSFLARKVLFYNGEHFINDKIKVEDKSPFTVYFKLNKNFTNGFCCDIPTIMTFDKHIITRYRNGNIGINNYNDTVLRTSIYNKKVGYGLPVCKEFMINFFLRQGRLDKWM